MFPPKWVLMTNVLMIFDDKVLDLYDIVSFNDNECFPSQNGALCLMFACGCVLVRKVQDSVSNNCPVLIFGSVCLLNSFTINFN